MDLVQIALVNVGRQEDVQRLRLADIFRAVAGMFDEPALVHLKGRFEDILLIVGEEVEVLHGALVQGDVRPDLFRVLTLFLKQLGIRCLFRTEKDPERVLCV